MKRFAYILLPVCVLFLVQCTEKWDGNYGEYEPSDQPLVFSVYGANQVNTWKDDVTRGVVNDRARIYGYNDEEGVFHSGIGVGVFAFHQPAKSNGYPVDYNHNMGEPEFMYNQQLQAVDKDGLQTWTYSPIKFWPNNVNDQLSFFAYAPYDYRAAWDEDMDITCNLQGTKFKKSYRIYSYPEDQSDYLWCDPILNVRRGDITEVIHFQFKHICAQVGFKVGVSVNPTSDASSDATVWDDPNTDIVIKSIKIEDVYSDYEISTIYDKESTPQFTETWTEDGSMTINFVSDNMVERGVISINSDIHTFTDTEWTTDNWANQPTFKRLNRPDSYLFLAPQKADDQKMKFTVTYDLKTRNLKSGSTSTITKTYTHDMRDLGLAGDAFEAGKAYSIIYLLGIRGIEVTAVLSEWDEHSFVTTIEE